MNATNETPVGVGETEGRSKRIADEPAILEPPKAGSLQSLLSLVDEIWGSVPDEEFDKLPRDSADQLDRL